MVQTGRIAQVETHPTRMHAPADRQASELDGVISLNHVEDQNFKLVDAKRTLLSNEAITALHDERLTTNQEVDNI